MKTLKGFIIIIILFFASTASVFASDILINEFVGNPNTGEKEWVEFYNPENIDISSYWIDDDLNFIDDSGNSSKKILSSIDLSNPTYSVYTLSSGMFNNSCDPQCDYVVLFSSEGSIIDQFQYADDQISQKGKSLGRSQDSLNNWTILASVTKGGQNSSPEPTPTPTLEPTPTPTLSPKPSLTIKPISTPKPTLTSRPISTAKPSESATRITESGSTVLVKATPISKVSIAEDKKNPSLKLEEDKDKKLTAKKISNTPKTEVLGISKTNYLSKALIGVGIVLLLACGILGFRSMQHRRNGSGNY